MDMPVLVKILQAKCAGCTLCLGVARWEVGLHCYKPIEQLCAALR